MDGEGKIPKKKDEEDSYEMTKGNLLINFSLDLGSIFRLELWKVFLRKTKKWKPPQ